MKTVIEMAREAGIGDSHGHMIRHELPNLERLVELARADEREACAKVCEAMRSDTPMGNAPRIEALFHAVKNIRARSNT